MAFTLNKAAEGDTRRFVSLAVAFAAGQAKAALAAIGDDASRDADPHYVLRGGLLAWVHAGGKVYDKNGETRRIHVYGRKWNLGPRDYEGVW